MANLTIDEAIIRVRQFLDDTSSVEASQRWTDARIMDALSDCLSSCLSRYALEGGDRFDLETTGDSSATDGTLSISSVSPLVVKQVALVVGTATYRLPAEDRLRRGVIDTTARGLRIWYVRDYQLSSITSHPLVGVAGTAANSWRAFDRWVVFEATLQLAMKDMEMERLKVLTVRTEEAAKAALARPTSPIATGEMPRPEWSPVTRDLYWRAVMPSTIYLTRAVW